MEDLKEAGLDDEEAFLIAMRRLGKINDLEEEYRQENSAIIQTRRTAIMLAGVLMYFFFFHLFGSISKLLFITLLELDFSGSQALLRMNRFLISAHFIFIVLFTTILVSEKKIVALI